MAQSLAKVYIHIVFSTKDRKNYITDEMAIRLYAYICKICTSIDCPIHQIGGMKDHVHILLEQSRTIPISKILEKIKANTSYWIRSQFPNRKDFSWQSGYGVFSVDYNSVDAVKTTLKIKKNII